MRYRDGQAPDPNFPHTEGMETILMFSVILSLIVGLVLLAISLRGRVIWLGCWSAGLVVCSVVYIAYSAIT